jgi:hypothetical protein
LKKHQKVPGIAELAMLESIHSTAMIEDIIESQENQETVRLFYPENKEIDM